MRNSGSYQLVSEHSILSAWRKNRDAAGTRRTHGEHVRQIGATRESDCRHDTKVKAPSDFKVYDPGLGQTENTNSRRRRSREDEFHEKIEEIAEILRSYLSNVAVKSIKPEEEGNTELEDVKPETEESEKEKDRIGGCSCVIMDVLAKSEGDEIDSERQQPREQSVIEAQRQGDYPEDASSPAPDRCATVAEESPLTDLGEISLSCVTGVCDKEKKEDRATRKRGDVKRLCDDEDAITAEVCVTIGGCDAQSGEEEEAQPEATSPEALLGESSPEEEDGGVTVKVTGTVGVGNVFLSFGNEKHDRFGKERKAGADWISQDLGLLTEPMGQAQSLIFTPPHFSDNRGVFLIKGIMDKKEFVGYDWAQNLAERREFDPGGRPSISCIAWSSCFKLWDPGELYSASCIIETSCFKLWDPGGRVLLVYFDIFTLRTR